MTADAHIAAQFYATTRGVVAQKLLRERLTRGWPALPGLSVLGLGYAAPYLRCWPDAARCVAVAPAPTGAARTLGIPRARGRSGNIACTAGEGALPFPDLCFDRILLIHALEAADSARTMLREVWRVLKDDGKLMLVAPNRIGLWAHVESTPFGHGQPYSPGQIDRLLAASLFRVERRDTALYMPPVRLRLLLRTAHTWERAGRYLMPELAGVTVTEAVKDAYAGLPLNAARRRVVVSQAA